MNYVCFILFIKILETGKSPPGTSLPGFVPSATQDWLLDEGGASTLLSLRPYRTWQPMRGVETPTSSMRYRERKSCFSLPPNSGFWPSGFSEASKAGGVAFLLTNLPPSSWNLESSFLTYLSTGPRGTWRENWFWRSWTDHRNESCRCP